MPKIGQLPATSTVNTGDLLIKEPASLTGGPEKITVDDFAAWLSIIVGVPVYPSNEIVFGDGSTPGGTTDPNFTKDKVGVIWIDTRANILANTDIKAGDQVIITDANPFGVGSMLKLDVTKDANDNILFSRNGTLVALNADFQGVGSYGFSAVPKGIWNPVKGTLPIDMSTATMTVKYKNLAGGTFSSGAATSNGNAINIDSDNGVDTMVISGFSGATVTGVIAQGGVTADQTDKYIYSIGETVTGGTSGATALNRFKVDDTDTQLSLNQIAGTFDVGGETLTGSNGNVIDSTAGVTYTNNYLADDVTVFQDSNDGFRYKNWRNLTGVNSSTSPDLDNTNWGLLSPDVANGYTVAVRSCQYDIVANNMFQSQENCVDGTLNKVEGMSTIKLFAWGCSAVSDLTLINCNFQLQSPNASIISGECLNSSTLVVPDLGGNVFFFTIKQGSFVVNNTGVMTFFTVEEGSSVDSNTGDMIDFTVAQNVGVNNNTGNMFEFTVEQNGNVNDNTGDILWFTVKQAGSVANNTGDMNDCTIGQFANVSYNPGDLSFFTIEQAASCSFLGASSYFTIGKASYIDGDVANNYSLDYCITAPGAIETLTASHSHENLDYTTSTWSAN